MLVNIHHDSPREHARLLVAGVGFLTAMALLIGLSIAIYNKSFDKPFNRVATVKIEADRAGLQLNKFGDVRRNGVLVGQVRSVESDGEKAIIEVALEPDKAAQIPANVGVQIVPTTLFGQKFISFVDPVDPSSEALADDDVIPAERVDTRVELSSILDNLFVLLEAVQPADLKVALDALATALEGRGDQLGQTLDELGVYLNAIEPELPTLRQDLIALADVAETYDDAAPDLLRVLDNLTVTGRTIVEKRESLDVFFSDLTGLADTATDFLATNEQNLIRAGEVTAPVLKLLATYSPEFPCLIRGAANYEPILAKTFEGNQVKQYVETGTPQYQSYKPSDRPVFGEKGHGPWCSGLPNPPVPIGPVAFNDGTEIDDNPPTSDLPGIPLPRTAPGWARDSGFQASMSSGYAGTRGDQFVINALLAGKTGRPADYYGSLGSLLYGPVVRGGE